MPRLVAYNAVVTLKNHRTGGGYLHSHYHLYPEGVGARQQQVRIFFLPQNSKSINTYLLQITTYTHKDDNNKWIIKPYNADSVKGIKVLKSGDLIRIEHLQTKRNLHTHKEPAPVMKKHFQVTGYGEVNAILKILFYSYLILKDIS